MFDVNKQMSHAQQARERDVRCSSRGVASAVLLFDLSFIVALKFDTVLENL